jgi:hypothetical protein
MRNALLVAALAAVAVAPCFAQRPRPHGAEFQPFYADFLKAVRANDREKLADMILTRPSCTLLLLVLFNDPRL